MKKNVFFFVVVFAGVGFLLGVVFPPAAKPLEERPELKRRVDPSPYLKAVGQVDEALTQSWAQRNLKTAPRASDLQIMRRVALGLMGTLPSLEEIRLFERRAPEERILWWVDHVLKDRRCSDYLAERFARGTVGVNEGPFLVFRRRRYVSWLSKQLQKGKRFDQIVREIIDTEGLWTDKPAVNFVTSTFDPNTKKLQPVLLAGRVSRMFLGVRMDCAQCHDHPFENWTQKDFHGIAAFFSKTRQSGAGIRNVDDDAKVGPYTIENHRAESMTIAPKVPFLKDLLSEESKRPLRSQLAQWVTHKDNRYFARAITNRMWALLLGRPLVEPVDDLPVDGPYPAPLEVLAQDFAKHGYDLRRLIRVITLSQVFQLDSALPGAEEISEDQDLYFAVFPLSQLRPEQVVGSIIQSAVVETIDQDSLWLTRFTRFTQENEFTRRYGDLGEDRFESGVGTIPQRLLMMNGKIVTERSDANPFTSSGRYSMLAPNAETAVECMWLSCLTRRPTDAELAHFVPKLRGLRGDTRQRVMQDIHWTLMNTTEFSWNH